MNKYIKHSILGLAMAFSLSACLKDLDQEPIDPDSFTEKDVFKNATEAKSALAKIYASMAVTGQKGPSGDGDLANADESSTQFTRVQFYLQESSTDEAIIRWADAGVPDFHNMSWTPSNAFTNGYYNRLGQQIAFANSFIDNAKDLASDPEVAYFIAEARFIRAYAYYNVIDAFGKAPLITSSKADLKPAPNSRAELFNFVETELKDLEGKLKPARTNEYGRVDQAAAWALLSRLYLNAEVYTGNARWADCMTYAKKVIDNGSYTLVNDYNYLFLADNDTNGAQNENIFTANFDGLNSQTWAGSTFLVHAAIGGDMNAENYGVGSGWGGIRSTKALVEKFNGTGTPPTSWTDKRAMFYTQGQEYEINSVSNFKHGYAITKYKNVTSAGVKGKDPGGNYVDTDVALIRLAEMYLNYAEAAFKTGNQSDARTYLNRLRQRAGVSDLSSITEEEILNERARELYWEGFRRTDLIRFNRFTEGSYLWPFKGGVAAGTAVDNFRKLYPIPANVVLASGGVIKQNTGY